MLRSTITLAITAAIMGCAQLCIAQTDQATEMSNAATVIPSFHLPVELVNFTVGSQGTDAILKWDIANEVNIEYYEIEVAKGNTDFVSIGKVLSIDHTGNGAKASYSFNYRLPTGAKYFFRLKMVDMNGSFLTSYIRTLNAQTADMVNIRMSPNPATDRVMISGMRDGANLITLCDATGTRLMTFNTTETEASINFANLLPGLYNIIVQDGTGVATSRRLMKQ